jgi:hypothetical protein
MVLDWFQMQDRQHFVDAVLLIVMMHIEEYNTSAAAAAATMESYGC